VKVGDLVLPKRSRVLLDSDSVSEKVSKLDWRAGTAGLIVEIEAEMPKKFDENNRMVRVLTSSGLGWCFVDEVVPVR
jgi:hypothetical protein